MSDARLLELWRSVQGPQAGLTGPLIRFAAKVREARSAELTGDATEPDRVRVLEQAIGNCYMMAKREIARMLNRSPMDVGVASDKITLERWQHVQRFCETTGSKSSILRGQLPTEMTEGEPPCP